jgi:hypothetical protein
MKRTFANKQTVFAGLICSLLLLSACATSTVDSGAQTSDPGNSIEARAMARWDALLAGDLPAAYGFLSPAYRSSVSSLQYQRSIVVQKVHWTGAEYVEADCEETTCNVKISLDFAIYGALPGVRSFEESQTIDEAWVLVDGIWYFVPPQ